MEKDPAIFEEINYYVTCHLIFPTISYQSRSSETSLGDSRGVSGLFNLPQSTDSIESHLCLIHLSKESVTEGELIFARAGLFDVEDSVMAKCGSAQSIGTLMGSSGAKVQRASIRHTLVAIPKG